eukprot:GHVR01093536.1.p1 GENE.GHVR01093536.1~~GHVR01093536.1.p1  ORF type:complete len:377 (+),score=51.83 GHVR01093536.1:46-1176(+)
MFCLGIVWFLLFVVKGDDIPDYLTPIDKRGTYELEVEGEIGRGGLGIQVRVYGNVFGSTKKGTYLAKIMGWDNETIRKEHFIMMLRGHHYLLNLNIKYVMKVYEIFYCKDNSSIKDYIQKSPEGFINNKFNRDTLVCIISEFLRGGPIPPDLPMDSPKRNRSKKDVSVLLFKMFKQMVASVANLHIRQLIHGDINSGNFVLDSNGDVVLIDFDGVVKKGDVSLTVSPFFKTPSFFHRQDDSDAIAHEKDDVYSLGRLLQYMCTADEQNAIFIAISTYESDLYLPHLMRSKDEKLVKSFPLPQDLYFYTKAIIQDPYMIDYKTCGDGWMNKDGLPINPNFLIRLLTRPNFDERPTMVSVAMLFEDITFVDGGYIVTD